MQRLTRRELLRRAGQLGVSAGGLAVLAACGRLSTSIAPAVPTRSEARLETTILRFAKNESLCFAPQYLADDLLRAKGFTDVQYVDSATATLPAVAAGEADMAMGRPESRSSEPTPTTRSSSWQVSTSDVTSCSRVAPFAR